MDALAISTHHDSVTGTSAQQVVYDYERIFKEAKHSILNLYFKELGEIVNFQLNNFGILDKNNW